MSSNVELIDQSNYYEGPMDWDSPRISIWHSGYIDCTRAEKKTYFENIEIAADIGAYIDGASRLGGSYSMVVMDKIKNEYHLFTDSLGMGIVYYTPSKAGNLWAFSLMKLVKSISVIEVDDRAFDEYMLYRWLTDGHSMIKGIARVLPGQRVTLRIDEIELKQKPLLSYDTSAKGQQLETIIQATREALDTHYKRLRQTYSRIAIFLSGGVDSSLLLAKALEHDFPTLIAVTCRFVGRDNPELDRAIFVAEQLKVTHVIVDITDADVIKMLPQISLQLEAPISYFNLIAREAMLAKLAGQIDAIVLGEGADGMFSNEVGGGANALRFHAKQRYIKHIPARLKKYIGIAMTRSNNQLIRRVGYNFCNNTATYLRHQGALFPSGSKDSGEISADVLIPSLERIRSSRNGYFYRLFEGDWSDNAITPTAIMKFSRNRGLYTQNRHQVFCYARISQAWGIVSVFPFFSEEIKTIGLNLSDSLRQDERGTKPVLKTLLRQYLPESIVYAEKMGFETPLEDFLRENESFWREMLSDTTTAERGLFDQEIVNRLATSTDSLLIMAAVSLEIYFRQFTDRQSGLPTVDTIS